MNKEERNVIFNRGKNVIKRERERERVRVREKEREKALRGTMGENVNMKNSTLESFAKTQAMANG